MAEYHFYQKRLFIPCGKYRKEYPFALTIFQNADHDIIGSGYAPSGYMLNAAEPILSDGEIPFELDPIWDFTFYLSDQLATGINHSCY